MLTIKIGIVGCGGLPQGLLLPCEAIREGVLPPGHREELGLRARSMLEGADCHADLEDGWWDMLVVEALHRAITTGEAQSIPIHS